MRSPAIPAEDVPMSARTTSPGRMKSCIRCQKRSWVNADLGGEHRAKPVPPKPDRLVANVDSALGEQILDVAQRQRAPHVHHYHQANDLRRAVEISERV